jgi:aspartyl-tRNA(Asn)/glutamyl-tRNA(Gln) amidotransferase subunit A
MTGVPEHGENNPMDPIFFYKPDQDADPLEEGDALAQDTPSGTTVGEVTTHDHRTTEAGDAPLHGLRVAVQPTISVRGWPANAGSQALAGFIALEDATVVQRLREAGACLCGSTHVSEFGFGLQGDRAGEALGQQAAGIELVLDLSGEGRLAAARAGVYGLKLSYGLVSRFGLIDLIPSMTACALLSTSLDDIGRVLAAVAGPDGRDFSLPADEAPGLLEPTVDPQTVDPQAITLGIITEAVATLPTLQAEDFRASLTSLTQQGFRLHEVSLPDLPLFSLVHKIVGSVEASSATGRYDSVRYGPRAPGAKNWNEMYLLSRGAAFGTLLKSYLIQGAFFQFERYAAFEDACRIRRRLVEQMERLETEVDYLVLPLCGDAAAGTKRSVAGADSHADDAKPFSLDYLYETSVSTLAANVTGRPALYVPPMNEATEHGLQFVGPRLSDMALLALGDSLRSPSGRGGA